MARRFPGLALHWQILIAIALAVAAGMALPKGTSIGGFEPLGVFDFLGTIFLRALQMLVFPLIASALIAAVNRLGEEHAFQRLGLKSIGYYVATGLLAILTGLLAVNLLQPGKLDPALSAALIADSGTRVDELAEQVREGSGADFASFIKRMVPSNVFQSLSNNREMLAVVFFGLLFGYFSTKLPKGQRERFGEFFESVNQVMTAMTAWVMRFAPIGVFGLVAETVATTGLASIKPLAVFFAAVLIALAFHSFVTLSIVLRLFGIRMRDHLRGMSPALLTAFSTSSSAATLPVTLECLEKRAGVSERVRGFFIPIGANVNMDGTALYECAAAIFIAQIYGIEISLGVQFTVVVMALLTSIGVAGVPAASLVAIIIILNAIGLPLEGIGLIMAVDRILDMCRTAVNVYGDTVGAAVIAKSEGESLYARAA